MSFTLVASWDHMQDRTRANEIIAAYSERRQAIGQSAVTALASGTAAQSLAYWKAIQQWIETYASSFVNHTATIEGEASITMWTFSTMVAATDMNASGWRRATSYNSTTDDWTDVDDAMYATEGQIESGDIRGPWIFDDLQMALDMLRWTKRTATNWRVRHIEHVLETWSAWDYTPESIFYKISSAIFYPPDDPPFPEWTRYAGQVRWLSCPTIASTISVFATPTARYGSFVDCDSLGLGSFEDVLWNVENLTSSSDATRTSNILGDIDTAPGIGGTDEFYYCQVISTVYGVFKWTFTHTL